MDDHDDNFAIVFAAMGVSRKKLEKNISTKMERHIFIILNFIIQISSSFGKSYDIHL